jgi:hypothetical protein
MTDPQRKLTVRVKLAPESGPDVTENPKYAYRWDRIALVALALVVVVAIVFRTLLTPEQPPAEGADAADPGGNAIAASAPKPAPEAEAAKPAEGPAPAITEREPEPQPATRIEEPAPATAATESSMAPAPPPERLPAAQPDTAVAAAPTGLPPEPPAAQPPPASAPRTATPVAGGQIADEPAPPAATRSPRDGLLAPGATRILSDRVTRFLLTDEVRDLEPVGGLSDIRARPPGGPLAVFAFSDVRELGGETLHYRWIRDGKVAANVKVRVGSDRWRSYSSKFINEAMRGPWRVELRNSAGDLLAQAEFEY